MLLKITEDEFIERFRPETQPAPGGTVYRRICFMSGSAEEFREAKAAFTKGLLWSMGVRLSTSRRFIRSGRGYIGATHYLIATLPVFQGEQFLVELEGRRR